MAGDRSFTINLRPGAFIFPRERRHSFLASAEQRLAEGLRFGLTGSYSRRSTARTYFQSISPLPIDARARAEATSLTGELSYEFGGWRARLEGNYALSNTDQRQSQPGGQELVNARDVRNEVLEGAVKADGPLFGLPGGPVRVAVGAELRREAYRDGFESSGIARIVDRQSRHVRSLFAEFSVPLFSSRNRVPGIERLQLSAAGRFDDYSRTGSTFDPKVGLLWSPVRGLDLRASYGTSFRAPLLSEVGGAYNVIFLPAFFIYRNPAEAPPGSIAAVLQGSNPNVRPETSRTWSAGAEFSPESAPGLTLSVNYYSVRFANRIALPARFIVVVGDPAFEAIIDRDPDVAALTEIVAGAQLILDATGPGFSNGGATAADVDIVLDDRVGNTALTTTRGFDFGVRYAFDAGANRFVLEANVNHVLEFDDQLTPTSPVAQSLDRTYGPLSWRGRGGVGWSRGSWAGSLFVNYAGAYEDDRQLAFRPIGSHTTVDLSLSYTFSAPSAGWLRGTRLSLFAENLFDNRPPGLLPEPSSSSGLGYDPVNASGRGRFVSIQLRRSW
jgi:outer membrane receptor protein involved in Fe transport